MGLRAGVVFRPLEIGDLIGRLEAAVSKPVDLVLLEEAPAPVAYRIFRDAIVLVERDRPAMVERKARAILAYLDFRPFEEILTRGVLAAATRSRGEPR